MAARPLFALISMILVAGAIVLTFFVLLAGAINDNPVNKFYFLSADTSDITGAPAESRWTFWNVCGTTSNGRNDCGKVHPAYPFNPPSNFGTKTNVPQQFIGTKEYYYLTRFMFAFDLIYLFFAVCSLAVGLLALCTRIGSYLAGLFAMIAAFFSVLTAALMTAAYVKGRNNFISNDQTAHLGNAVSLADVLEAQEAGAASLMRTERNLPSVYEPEHSIPVGWKNDSLKSSK
ncbi:putative actin cortical patch protein sur7 [Phaeomoniella chlamydospora]|uniref:Putative actin cortical patch protein sur7 n=1 Tax=Phaeomoniella chlamydospora TaxID=158046 RepID=A0A0G2EPP8_PHACM|nr:putative actin cortical patch protein sur7 [Phaeomoniella chlamydospora]